MQQETRHLMQNKCTYKDLGLQFVPRVVHRSWPVGCSHIALFNLLVWNHHALDVMHQRLHKEDQSSGLSWGLWVRREGGNHGSVGGRPSVRLFRCC